VRRIDNIYGPRIGQAETPPYLKKKGRIDEDREGLSFACPGKKLARKGYDIQPPPSHKDGNSRGKGGKKRYEGRKVEGGQRVESLYQIRGLGREEVTIRKLHEM